MNLPLLCLAGLAIIVIIVVMAWHRNNASWGFKDIVKNPQYWEELSKANEDLEAGTQAAKLWTDDKVASFTKNFVLKSTAGSDSSDDMHILRSLGERTHPVVLELLGDASLYKVLVKPTATNVLPEAPLNRACDLLGDSPPPAAVQLLAPFLNDPSEEIRKDAALAIAKTGDAAISPLVKKAFSDSDEYVRSYALMGLDFALNRSALADSAQAELF
ncbi:MAG: HEAT repeat domain-containing protein, partial [Chthoniobacterales bacterium]